MAMFGYGWISTTDQSAENQRMEVNAAGYAMDYWFADEGVSGAVMAQRRPKFGEMLGKVRKGEVLVVTKIDRLGHDAIDILATVRDLKTRGVLVHVTPLGGTDLTGSAGKLLLAMLSAFAEMERDLIVEGTQAGLARAKAEGRKLGRSAKTTDRDRKAILAALATGASVSEQARQCGISRASGSAIRAAGAPHRP